MLTFRVHDTPYVWDDKLHNDRFEQALTLAHGWNDLTISLSDIRRAPKDREMDLENIKVIGISATDLPAPRVIYIDNIRLGNRAATCLRQLHKTHSVQGSVHV